MAVYYIFFDITADSTIRWTVQSRFISKKREAGDLYLERPEPHLLMRVGHTTAITPGRSDHRQRLEKDGRMAMEGSR